MSFFVFYFKAYYLWRFQEPFHSIKAYPISLISVISLTSDFSFNSWKRENPTSLAYCFKNSQKTLQESLERSSGEHHMQAIKSGKKEK